MASHTQGELATFSDRIAASIDRMIACLDTLTDAQARQRPPVPNSNSVLVLLIHTIGSVEKRVLDTICGHTGVERDRDSEFIEGDRDIAWVHRRWDDVRPRLAAALAALPDSAATEPRTRPDWPTATVREFLIQISQHIAEHTGHAELTRDWVVGQTAD